MSAEGSRASLRYKKEVVYGVPPGGQLSIIDFTEESFVLDKTKERKKKVLTTREYSGMTTKSEETSGGFQNPLQNNNTDDFFELTLMALWTGITGAKGGKITAGSTAGNLDIAFVAEVGAGVGGIITFGSLIDEPTILLDQWLFIKGATENDGAYIVTEVIDTHNFRVNNPLVTATYEAGCEASGDMVRNGATLQSVYIERAHTDIGAFFQYSGQTVDNLEVTFEPEDDVTLAFEFMGKTETTSTDTVSDPVPADAVDNPYFTCGDNVDGIFIDYVPLADCLVQSLSFNISNQTENKKAVAVFGPCGSRIKPIDVTGSTTMFFEDLAQYNKYPLDTEFQLAISIADSNGIHYGYTLAKTEFTTGSTNVTDPEDSVDEEHEFAVSTNGAFTIQICKSVA